MKAITGKAADGSGNYTGLDTIRLSEAERRHARASLRNGEVIAGLVLRAMAKLQAIARSVERAAVSLAEIIRTALAKPVKR